MPFGSLNGSKDLPIRGSASASFGNLAFVRPGTFQYTVAERTGNEASYACDRTVYTVTFVVTEVRGVLQVQRVITANGKVAEQLLFTNVYRTPEEGKEDLRVSLSASTALAKPGSSIIYTLTVKNNGTTALTGIRLRDYVPQNTTLLSIGDQYGKPGTVDGSRQISWFLETLGAGKSVTLSFTVKVNDGVPEGIGIKNTVLYTITGSTTVPSVNDPADPGTSTNSVKTAVENASIPLPPHTGDSSALLVSVALLMSCGVGAVTAVRITERKKRTQR